MKTIRTLVVDDEPLARARILNLLKQDTDIELIGESRNGHEAASSIIEKKPDLIFLDIQMPDMDGFGVLKHIPSNHQPFIIFVTAYDQYALKAFEVHAIDYLLKPYDNERFKESLNLAKRQIHLREASKFNNKLIALLEAYQHQQSDFIHTFCIKKQGREIKINVNEVFFIEANGNYLNLHTKTKYFLYRCTMNAIQGQLDPNHFLRIHRSYIVHTNHIEKITYLNNNEYRFILKNGQELISGRSFKQDIMDYLSQSILD